MMTSGIFQSIFRSVHNASTAALNAIPRAAAVVATYAWKVGWIVGNKIIDQSRLLGTDRDPIGGRWREFDGAGQYTKVADSGLGYVDSQEFTISAWVMPLDAANHTVIWSYDHTTHVAPHYRQHLRVDGEQNNISFRWQTSLLSFSPTETLQNRWSHIVAKHRDGRQELWLDGVIVAEKNLVSVMSYDDQEVWVGKANFGLTKSCRIWNLRFYDHFLTDEQSVDLFEKRHKALPGIVPPVYLPFEVYNPTSEENIGSGPDGVSVGYDVSSEGKGSDVPGSRLDDIGYGRPEVFTFGDNSGNDMWWGDLGALIPFDPSKIYEIKFKDVVRTEGAGSCYLGWMGYAADAVTKVNIQGTDTYNSQHYHAASNVAPATKSTYTGYTMGFGNPGGNTGTNPPVSSPLKMHEDVRYLKPLIIVNYSALAGIFEIGEIEINEVDSNGDSVANIATYSPSDEIEWNRAGGSLDSGSINPPVSANIQGDLDRNGNALKESGVVPKHAKLVGGNCLKLNGIDEYGELESDVSLNGPFRIPISFNFQSIRANNWRTLLAGGTTSTQIMVQYNDKLSIRRKDHPTLEFDVLPGVEDGNHTIELIRDENDEISVIYDGVEMPIKHTLDHVFTIRRVGFDGISLRSGNDPSGGLYWGLSVEDDGVLVLDCPMSDKGIAKRHDVRDVPAGNHLNLFGYSVAMDSGSQDELHYNLSYGFSDIAGQIIPAKNATHDAAGNLLTNPANPKGHNDAESKISTDHLHHCVDFPALAEHEFGGSQARFTVGRKSSRQESQYIVESSQ